MYIFKIFFLTLFLSITSELKNVVVYIEGNYEEEISYPTKDELYDYLVELDFIDPVATWRISMLETGHLKSKISTEKNNLFGLRSTQEYKEFQNWKECVKYMRNLEKKKWEKYILTTENPNYYDFIAWWGYKTGKSYSDDDIEYSEFIKKIKSPNK